MSIIMSRFQHNSVKRDESNKLYKVWIINWRASCNILHPKNVSRNSLKNQMFLSRFLSFHRRIIIITYKSPNKRRDSIIDTNVNNRRVQAFWELGCILVDLYVIISSIPNNKIKKGKTHKRFFFLDRIEVISYPWCWPPGCKHIFAVSVFISCFF